MHHFFLHHLNTLPEDYFSEMQRAPPSRSGRWWSQLLLVSSDDDDDGWRKRGWRKNDDRAHEEMFTMNWSQLKSNISQLWRLFLKFSWILNLWISFFRQSKWHENHLLVVHLRNQKIWKWRSEAKRKAFIIILKIKIFSLIKTINQYFRSDLLLANFTIITIDEWLFWLE